MSEAMSRPKKRALILAGGGIKVAFQAGVLQVWLDEAGLTFDHADGASGGVFNLAMYCQGMTGSQIAENWRNTKPLAGVDFNWEQYAKLFYAESVSTLDHYRAHIFPGWGLDWTKIRTSDKAATFNVYNFSTHELEVLTPDMMSEDFLVAGVSLPMWFPPVIINGNTYIDSVYITDANIEEAIRRGADEVWVIWTVSQRSEWNAGFVANYFQIIETAANGHFRRIMHRIEANNAALASGQAGEFGRHIDVKILSAEVPMHYLIDLSADRMTEAVNRGVEAARTWCAEQGIALNTSPEAVSADPTSLSFTEKMKGFIAIGTQDYQQGFTEGSHQKTAFMFQLTIKVDGINRFVTEPEHEASAEGWISCDALGGKLPVQHGTFHLFVDDGDPTRKKMLYRLFFQDSEGRPLTLSGFKDIVEDPHVDVWRATSTLYTHILQGHVQAADEAQATIMAAGIIHIHLLDFLEQLTTFRTEGPSTMDRAAVLGRFGALFLGSLWDVYARQVLSYAPF